jgi:homoserine O-acetyltransferase
MDEFLQDYEIFDLGDVTLQHGATLCDAKLAYKTYGALNADKTNAIVYPTWYSGRHWDNEWLIGGAWPWIRPSTSSSSRTSWAMGSRLRRRTHRPPTTPRFPHVTFYDQASNNTRSSRHSGSRPFPS